MEKVFFQFILPGYSVFMLIIGQKGPAYKGEIFMKKAARHTMKKEAGTR